MGKNIDEIRDEMIDDGVIQENTKKSVDWLVRNIAELSDGKEESLIRELKRTSDIDTIPRVGKFYMFSYLPKHRATLPYYDRFPLIIVLRINYKEKYMLGLNMHYLPLKIRARFFKSILMFLNNKKWDETTRFRVTWDLLKTLSTSPLIYPAIKRYNFEQLKSRFIHVEEDEWDIVLMLPTHIFKKARATEVWLDTMQMIAERSPKKERGPRKRVVQPKRKVIKKKKP